MNQKDSRKQVKQNIIAKNVTTMNSILAYN